MALIFKYIFEPALFVLNYIYVNYIYVFLLKILWNVVFVTYTQKKEVQQCSQKRLIFCTNKPGRVWPLEVYTCSNIPCKAPTQFLWQPELLACLISTKTINWHWVHYLRCLTGYLLKHPFICTCIQPSFVLVQPIKLRPIRNNI